MLAVPSNALFGSVIFAHHLTAAVVFATNDCHARFITWIRAIVPVAHGMISLRDHLVWIWHCHHHERRFLDHIWLLALRSLAHSDLLLLQVQLLLIHHHLLLLVHWLHLYLGLLINHHRLADSCDIFLIGYLRLFLCHYGYSTIIKFKTD